MRPNKTEMKQKSRYENLAEKNLVSPNKTETESKNIHQENILSEIKPFLKSLKISVDLV